ncbi:DEAD-box ATP-dependent RNA helicase 57-like [Olea europaea var. sylvestris]|uniref:DEAD-box ATP-dependent RNA helicase 57-like n=1 Tax=Olea europaea var. sylvestris TaxID=158386 RepID=UPI000C1D017B|nr:DEAD-box ATP-dependent RNA helicase 57-like [Olea europaea var. sylvestris]
MGFDRHRCYCPWHGFQRCQLCDQLRFSRFCSCYIHRIGRSGGAGRSGESITLYTEADVPFLRNVAKVMADSGCEVPS